MTICKAVVLISGGGSNLQAMIDAVQEGELPLQINCVISNQPDAFGLERAQKAGIQTACINHKDFANREEFDSALIEQIDQSDPDIVILAGFMRILTPEFVNHYKGRLVNIHPSLLPKYPGTNTHQRALDAEDTFHGISIHFVVPEVDAGPIILQGKIKVHTEDSANSLQQRIHKIEHILYPMAVKWLAQKRLFIIDGKVLLDNEHSIKQMQSFDL